MKIKKKKTVTQANFGEVYNVYKIHIFLKKSRQWTAWVWDKVDEGLA